MSKWSMKWRSFFWFSTKQGEKRMLLVTVTIAVGKKIKID